MRTIPATTVALCMALLLALSVTAQAEQAAYVDGTGAAVAYYQDAKRIVSLAPNVTEMVYFLGLGDRLVGRSSFCTYPPEAADVETVGGFVDTSLEKIISLDPDLVVGYQGNSRELITQLRQVGVAVLAFNEAATIAEIGEQMNTLFRVVAADSAVFPEPLADWKQLYADLATSAAGISGCKPRCFFGYPGETTYTCGPGCFLYDLIVQAGGQPVADDLPDRWAAVSAEYIVSKNPEWLLTGTSCAGRECELATREELINKLQADPVWSKLTAVVEKQIVVIDADVLLRPGPRILQALAILVDEFSAEAEASSNLKESE